MDIYEQKNWFEEYKDTESELLSGDFNTCKSPFISIVIPTYKRAENLQKAIDSAVNQKNADFSYEIIIVNNDPADDMAEIIGNNKRDNIYFYRNKRNIGMFANWNRCGELARGQYVSFLHDDDYLKDFYLCEIKKWLGDKRFKDVNLFVSKRDILRLNYPKKTAAGKIYIRCIQAAIKYFINFITCFRFIYRKKYKIIKPAEMLMSFGNIYGPPTCGFIIKKDDFLSTGGFNENLGGLADCFFFFNYNLEHKVCFIRKEMAVYVYKYGVNDTFNSQTQLNLLKALLSSLLVKHKFKTCNIMYRLFRGGYYRRLLIRARQHGVYDEMNKELGEPKPAKLKHEILTYIISVYKKIHNIDWC